MDTIATPPRPPSGPSSPRKISPFASAIALSGAYDEILSYVVAMDALFFGLTGAALLVFRARERRGADRADAGPDRISGAQRQAAHGDGQQPEAGDHADQGDERGSELAEALGLFHRNGPDNFQQTSEQKIDPGHGGLLCRGQAVLDISTRCGGGRSSWPAF